MTVTVIKFICNIILFPFAKSKIKKEEKRREKIRIKIRET